MTSKRNDAFDMMKVKHAMSRNNKTIAFPCVLKTIISHTHRDDKTFARNDKQIRATLRAKSINDHIRNTSWIATNMREYDAIRRAYDARYDASFARAKRVTKSRVAPNVVVVDDNANVDA